MSESSFLKTYLREIGVHTPISLLSLQSRKPVEVLSKAIVQEAAVNEVAIESIAGDMVALRQQASLCKGCALAECRKHVIFGVGALQAEILLIGEAPNAGEDEQGEPFVGEVGALLDAMLGSMQLSRKQVYMMNIVKCAPPNHRDPKPEELQACLAWLHAQLDFIKPKVIVLLGRVAAQALLQSDLPLKDLRQQAHQYQGFDVQVMYHPAYLLRSPRQKSEAWKDLQKLQSKLMR